MFKVYAGSACGATLHNVAAACCCSVLMSYGMSYVAMLTMYIYRVF